MNQDLKELEGIQLECAKRVIKKGCINRCKNCWRN